MPTYSIVTFGCQMNQHDSRRIGEVLDASGWTEASTLEQSDLVLLNTCSVREKAEQKLRSEVGRLAELKAKRPALLIGVAGCVAQQEGERLVARMPHVDLVVGPDNLSELPAILADAELGGPTQVRTVFDLDAPRFLAARPLPGAARPTDFVTTMKGCNERCSFCIVPTTRGPERYRPAREIVEEIARLVAAGTREVTLLGQTVNSYRDPERSLPEPDGAGERAFVHTHPTTQREDESEFPALLRRIASEVPELGRLRYTSPHPRHLTRSLIRVHAELEVLARHVHLPVQSGSDRVLKRMLRRYSVAEYHERVEALREAVPGVTLSTDVIVGFPGETPDDFARTLDLVASVGFTGLFGFKYSTRPYTPALKLDGEPPETVKDERLQALFAVSDRARADHLASLVGTTVTVLVEGRSKGASFTGRSERNEIVHFDADAELVGRILPVVVRRAFKNSLGGAIRACVAFSPRAWGAPAATRRRAPRSCAPRLAMTAVVRAYRGIVPRLGRDVFVAPTAAVVGDVELGDEASVWYGAVLRGDVGRIRVGRRTNVQDLAVVHMSLGESNAELGDDVTIGHHAVIHGAIVEDGALVGIGAIVLDNAVIGSEAMVGAGALVTAGMRVPPRTLVLGTPARVVRPLDEGEWTQGRVFAARYVGVAREHAVAG